MHKIEYILVKLLFALFSRISFESGKRIAWFLYILVAKVIRYRRKVIIENLQRVYGTDLPRPLHKMLDGIYRNFVFLWMEVLQIRRLNPQNLKQRITINGSELIDQALQEGKGILFLSGHYGNFEWLGQYYAMKGYGVNGIAKRQSNRYVNQLIEDIRFTNGAKVVYTKNAMQDGLEVLANNELLAIVSDQDGRKRGIFVDFLGQPSSTPVGSAIFQMRSGAPMFMIVAVRKDYGQFEAFVEPVYQGDKREITDDEIYKITQAHTRALEKWIRKYPEQWFWMHKRWKTAPSETEQ